MVSGSNEKEIVVVHVLDNPKIHAPFLKEGIKELRKVQWGNQFHWDIKFEDKELKAPFDQWFPASDVEFTLGGVNNHSVPLWISNYDFPLEYVGKSVQLTFYDDSDLTLEKWLKKWIWEKIFNKLQGVSPLADCVKLLQIVALNHKQEEVDKHTLWVYPEGNITFHGTSDNALVQHSVNFMVAGVGGAP